MNKEPIEGFIDALRSGRYKQIKGRGRTDDGFCAIGVGLDSFNPVWRKGQHDGWIYGVTSPRDSIEQACSYYGIDLGTFDKIINMNDDLNKTFEEIADWLEERLALEEAHKTASAELALA